MDVKQPEQELREGRVTAERLLQLLEAAQTRIQSLEALVKQLESKLAASGTEKRSAGQYGQDLSLRKSQVDALLRQLARHWEGEFDQLCTLLAHSTVVHADETSWSINSVWAFLSEKARVLLFGGS